MGPTLLEEITSGGPGEGQRVSRMNGPGVGGWHNTSPAYGNSGSRLDLLKLLMRCAPNQHPVLHFLLSFFYPLFLMS